MKVFGFWFALAEVFGDFSAFGVELVDFGFQRAGRGFTCGVDEAVCGGVDHFFEVLELGFLRFALILPVCDAAVPDVFEHGGGDGEEASAGG
ncbi:MAG: hypothetical protein AAF755_11045 [Pseudomonadota bacterium]